jgi:hypothetical protein
MTLAILSIALILTGFYALLVLYLFLAALIARSRSERRQREADRVRPQIASAVVDFAAGNNDLKPLRLFAKTHREVLEECLLQHHAAMRGESRDRLSELALDLALVHAWCEEARSGNVVRRRAALSRLAVVSAHEPSRRLSGEILHQALRDPDRECFLEAARALVHSEQVYAVAEVFQLSVSLPLIVRAILAQELRAWALPLCESAVPKALASGDSRRVQATLELVAAWECAVPLTGLAPLAAHPDTAIRVLALKVLPLTPDSGEAEAIVLRALAGEREDVSVAAAGAAGRMKLESAVAPLARCLRTGQVALARAAAAALAQMPPLGWETLQELSRHGNPVAASAALEALERARKGVRGA